MKLSNFFLFSILCFFSFNYSFNDESIKINTNQSDSIKLLRINKFQIDKYINFYKEAISRTQKHKIIAFISTAVAVTLVYAAIKKEYILKSLNSQDYLNYFLCIQPAAPFLYKSISRYFEPLSFGLIVKNSRIFKQISLLKSYTLFLDPNAQIFDLQIPNEFISNDQIEKSMSKDQPQELNEFIQLKFYINLIKSNGQLPKDIIEKNIENFRVKTNDLIDSFCRIISVLEILKEKTSSDIKDKIEKEIKSLINMVDLYYGLFEESLNSLKSKENSTSSLLVNVFKFNKELTDKFENITQVCNIL